MLISLVGLPGVGKSTAGRRLANHLGVDFIDCDALAEQRLGEAIATWFVREGEAAFRDLEETILREAIERTASLGAVIATGGGVVLREPNRRLLRDQTLCIWLDAKPETLRERLGRNNQRPLLMVADREERLLQLAKQRDPLYRETAAIVVPAGHSVGATSAAIERALRANEGRASQSTP